MGVKACVAGFPMELLASVGWCALVLGNRQTRGATLLSTATAPSFPGVSCATVRVSAYHRRAVRWGEGRRVRGGNLGRAPPRLGHARLGLGVARPNMSGVLAC